jgi:SM-20-related protein
MSSVDEQIADDIALRSYSVIPNFFDPNKIDLLRSDLLDLHKSGRFRASGVGQGDGHRATSEVRRDETCWHEPEALSSAQRLLWTRLESLKTKLNQTLQLGLWSIEGHYAVYPKGGFYHRHLDRFRSDDSRVISIVLYLTADWQPVNGGYLKFYVSQTSREILVEPRAGTLVCFLSGEMEHEVTQSFTQRLSFAAWMKRRNDRI